VACPQSEQSAAVLYPLGHPTPYAYGTHSCARGMNFFSGFSRIASLVIIPLFSPFFVLSLCLLLFSLGIFLVARAKMAFLFGGDFSIGAWQGVAIISIKNHTGPSRPTLLPSESGPYGRFGDGPPAERAFCGRLLPL
jgi:hypothetical protein